MAKFEVSRSGPTTMKDMQLGDVGMTERGGIVFMGANGNESLAVIIYPDNILDYWTTDQIKDDGNTVKVTLLPKGTIITATV